MKNKEYLNSLAQEKGFTDFIEIMGDKTIEETFNIFCEMLDQKDETIEQMNNIIKQMYKNVEDFYGNLTKK